MGKKYDFIMVYPHSDLNAYSQRVLLGVLEAAGYGVHLAIVPTLDGITSNLSIRKHFLDLIDNASVVGFGFFSTGYNSASYLTRFIKANLDKHVIWGGPHTTISYSNMVGMADELVLGEAEVTLLKSVEAVLSGRPISGLPQVITDKLDFRPAQEDHFVSDLNTLPPPFYSGNGQSLYLSDRLETDPEYFRLNFGGLQLLTTRGCAYQCSFCANSYLTKFIPGGVARIRKKSVDTVIGEIKHCQKYHSLKHVAIEDDMFFVHTVDYLEDFVDKFNKEIGLSVSITGLSPGSFNKDKLDIIRRLPLTGLRIGIQTTSECGLMVYNRKKVNAKLESLVNYIKHLPKKAKIRYDIILDNPYETIRDYITTLRFLSGLPKPFTLCLYHLTFYQGTALRDRALVDKIIDQDDNAYIYRRYDAYEDSYINSLFHFFSASFGYIPRKIIDILTSEFLIRHASLQAPIKFIVKRISLILEKIPAAVIYRFYLFLDGYYNAGWLRKKIRSFRHKLI